MLLCEGDDAPSPLLKNMKVQGVKGRREGRMHRQNSNGIERCDAVSQNAIDFVTFEMWEKTERHDKLLETDGT